MEARRKETDIRFTIIYWSVPCQKMKNTLVASFVTSVDLKLPWLDSAEIFLLALVRVRVR